ncbi:hypothetical protein HDV64DRAFT_116249 [Trichoderma sp. TUCIM 5745]
MPKTHVRHALQCLGLFINISKLLDCFHLAQSHGGKDSRQADITLLGSKIDPSPSG